MPETDDRPEVERFRDLARELEADEDEARFKEAAEKVVKAPKPEADDQKAE
ncbi:MAG: hypothetical protein Q7T19_02525 [Caulobacter sp.]|nr:hypothetical protein [Caulobacter sp.]